MIAPEFSRPRRLDTIGAGDAEVTIEANEAERAALSKRFGLLDIGALSASYTLRKEASGIAASGRLRADVTQACVVTGEGVPVTLDEPFALRFVPEDTAGNDEEEVELSEDALDTMFYEGSAIDLGEAAAETLALSLDPFPRSPNAPIVLKEAGVLSEEEVRPVSALAGLKDLLAKGK